MAEPPPDTLNAEFNRVLTEDRAALGLPDHFGRWLFAERLRARGERGEMGFFAYEGPGHVAKFFGWHRKAAFPDYLADHGVAQLARVSAERDAQVFDRLGLPPDPALMAHMGRYNAQDHILMHAYPVPERMRPRVLLDFGAGHGRLANLGFNAPDPKQRLTHYIAVDAIPSTYFVQRAYLSALGLKVWDYLDHRETRPDAAAVRAAMADHQVIHLPTWRLDLLPDGVADMVSCVQVLKELPGQMVVDAVRAFARLTGPNGAVYQRDHLQFHDPNHVPIDRLLAAAGFAPEWTPPIRDRTDLHGVPRIWRKVDPSIWVWPQNG
ncbi:MAG: hypothetical protein KF887_08315 [Paracoccaceae bacterium]|nr:MAG: hypothetical protein KF887_08315 [Paracoccaceae bacterium]